MKTTFRILAAGLAASLALVSCDKENLTKTENGAAKDGVRTITVSFKSDIARSELNGLQPKFKDGDDIKVSNGSKSETCTVSVDDKGVASITINDSDLKEAALTAVYPAAVWSDSEPYYTVSSTQDGSFAKANICKARIPAGSNDATFENQTAILKFSVPANADGKGVDYSPKTIKVKSRGSNSIASDDSKEIKISGTGTDGIPSDGGFYYMAVLPGETISNLTVCSGEGMRCPTASGTLSANTIYDVALPVLNGHEYVELIIPEMTFDSSRFIFTPTGSEKTLKWATMNVGASSPTGYGKYFAWGDVTGQNATTNGPGAFSTGFSWDNYRFVTYYNYDKEANDGDGKETFTFTKYYNGTESNDYVVYLNCFVDDKTTLDPEDDAAAANWGNTWRMPTNEEFAGLVALSTKSWNATTKGYNFTDAKGNSIFLPAAGHGVGTGMDNAGVSGYYWSSLLDAGCPSDIYYLKFLIGNASLTRCYRSDGQSVRPLSE